MNEPMLDAQEVAEERRGGEVLAWTLDHTEFYLDASDLRCDAGQMWLSVFVLSGVALGMIYEAMHLHAGPAKDVSSLVPFFGYCAQLLVALAWVVANRTWQGRWTRKMVASMVLSSMANGMAQALDYVALQEAGVMLFTIFHSSVTFFACLIAVLILRTRVTLVQWCACLAVVCGLVLSGVPSPVEAQGSFAIGIVAAAAGALCLAASYPLAELVFRLAPKSPPASEACSFVGSLLNVSAFGVWTLAYTVPRWDELVLRPIHESRYPLGGALVVTLYASHALMVGVHTLAFWKTVRTLGTVPTAISKGAQQALTFLLAHILFCHIDSKECMTHAAGNHTGSGDEGGALAVWTQAQKPVAFVVCTVGCLVYALIKQRPKQLNGSGSRSSAPAEEEEGTRTSLEEEPADAIQARCTQHEGRHLQQSCRGHEGARAEAPPPRAGAHDNM